MAEQRQKLVLPIISRPPITKQRSHFFVGGSFPPAQLELHRGDGSFGGIVQGKYGFV